MNTEIDTSYYTKFRTSKLRVTWQARDLLYGRLYVWFWLDCSPLEIYSPLHLPTKSRFSQIRRIIKRKRKRKWKFWPDQIDILSHVIIIIHNHQDISTNDGGDSFSNRCLRRDVRQNNEVPCHVASTWSTIWNILCMSPEEMIFHYPKTSSDLLHDCPLEINGPLNLFSKVRLSQLWSIINRKRKRN